MWGCLLLGSSALGRWSWANDRRMSEWMRITQLLEISSVCRAHFPHASKSLFWSQEELWLECWLHHLLALWSQTGSLTKGQYTPPAVRIPVEHVCRLQVLALATCRLSECLRAPCCHLKSPSGHPPVLSHLRKISDWDLRWSQLLEGPSSAKQLRPQVSHSL